VIAYLSVFFIATLFIAQLLGRLISHPQIAVVIVIMSSLPLVFTAGFIWPVESIPSWWHFVMSALPATTGIQYFLQIHLYDAPISAIGSEVFILVVISTVAAFIDYLLFLRANALTTPKRGVIEEG
jgi:ABC-2 type transport system permease protein